MLDERQMDFMAKYDETNGTFYTVTGMTDERRAIRPLLFEDRILAVEQKFFCDRTTEKTVKLTVTDVQNVPMVCI